MARMGFGRGRRGYQSHRGPFDKTGQKGGFGKMLAFAAGIMLVALVLLGAVMFALWPSW